MRVLHRLKSILQGVLLTMLNGIDGGVLLHCLQSVLFQDLYPFGAFRGSLCRLLVNGAIKAYRGLPFNFMKDRGFLLSLDFHWGIVVDGQLTLTLMLMPLIDLHVHSRILFSFFQRWS